MEDDAVVSGIVLQVVEPAVETEYEGQRERVLGRRRGGRREEDPAMITSSTESEATTVFGRFA